MYYRDSSYQKMLAQLAQCEFAMEKTQTVYEVNDKDTANYERIYKEVGKNCLCTVNKADFL